MNLYFVISVCLLLLIVFTVGDGVFKTTKLNKIFSLIFLLCVAILSFVSNVIIWEVEVDVAFISLFLVLVVGFLHQKTKKNILKTSLINIVTIVITLTYFAIFQNNYDFQFFKPYVIVAILLGISCYFITKQTWSAVFGLALGCSISSVLQVMLANVQIETFVFGVWALDIFLISAVSFLLTKHFCVLFRKFKRKKKQVLLQNQTK